MSSSVRKDILDSIKTKIDWRKVLRFFVKSSQKANKTTPSGASTVDIPTFILVESLIVLLTLQLASTSRDQSMTKMLGLFFAELNKLSEIASFTVIPFDTRVDEDKVYEWRKGQSRKVERVLHGGTCFDAPTKYVNERNFDGHIVLTDMCAPKPISSKCQCV